ncbi:MAG: hydrogenase maturation nickel metallochaperone HypA [Gammaproteobacteria bacterium]|nr:hydrogenase maturation nickel metallochaperone HypA [Gammaproteobacteria bacterium]
MHELSVCQSIIQQALKLADEYRAESIIKINLAIGPLAGIDTHLLKQAFPLASAGTLAETAGLETEALPIRVKCLSCQRESEAQMNRLICAYCNDWHTQLISGDEMLITSIEFETCEEQQYV